MKTPIRDYYYYERNINPENCIGILKALHDTTADERVLKLIQEVRKEQA